MFNKAKIIVKAIKLLRKSHKLYARAVKEKDYQLISFLDEIFDLAEEIGNNLHN